MRLGLLVNNYSNLFSLYNLECNLFYEKVNILLIRSFMHFIQWKVTILWWRELGSNDFPNANDEPTNANDEPTTANAITTGSLDATNNTTTNAKLVKKHSAKRHK